MERHDEPPDAPSPKGAEGFQQRPERLLVVVDPRKSETAAIADIHLAVRPGTDALLAKAMIALILGEGWEKTDYIEHHVWAGKKSPPGLKL
jgi:anaerobic selenocysteine-containing dehydrogenase